MQNLFEDVRDGMVILQVMDRIQPGVVDHSRVNINPTMVFKQTENCNYAVTPSLSLRLSLSLSLSLSQSQSQSQSQSLT